MTKPLSFHILATAISLLQETMAICNVAKFWPLSWIKLRHFRQNSSIASAQYALKRGTPIACFVALARSYTLTYVSVRFRLTD
jgi:hypothetical protein